MKPEADEVIEAFKYPNGRVYRIAGEFGPNDAVPPEAIVGAWKVNNKGQIIDEFIENPNYDSIKWPSPKEE